MSQSYTKGKSNQLSKFFKPTDSTYFKHTDLEDERARTHLSSVNPLQLNETNLLNHQQQMQRPNFQMLKAKIDFQKAMGLPNSQLANHR